MIAVRGYAAKGPGSPLEPFNFERREPGPRDVVIEILYCGICHSDIHQARNEWGASTYPMVPGHEIAGRVVRVGKQVKRFRIGDHAGVGCFVDSCRKCEHCREGVEQYCDNHISWSYNGTEQDKKTSTYGGYSSQIVVNEEYTLKIPPRIPMDKAAPLLCAGVTTYSPLRHFKVRKGQKAGIVGMGGLGHMAVKFAACMGAEVTVFSTSRSKEADARRFGAKQFVLVKDPQSLEPHRNRYHFMLDTVSTDHDLNGHIQLLRRDGVYVIVGVPTKPETVHAFTLIGKRRCLAGSVIGGIRETQEMLNFCAKHGITPDVEVIPAHKINDAYTRTVKSDVRYRFVIDLKTL